jgi:hydroxylamine reductase
MFCYQCEQTAKGTGCTTQGVCGKPHDVASLQDLLTYATKGIAMYAHRARQLGATDHDVNVFTIQALFTTITNVDFDPDRMHAFLSKAAVFRDKAKKIYEDAAKKAGKIPEKLGGPAAWTPAGDIAGLVKQGEDVTILKRRQALGDTVAGLQELLTQGLKGVSAYADHAQVLGKEDDSVYAGIHEALDFLTREKPTVDELLGMLLKCGATNLKTMEVLDAANTSAYGHPVPTAVRVEPVKGKALLVSGHDLKDLEEILKQTEGKGISVYTHGEMLPAHGYPGLNKYKHLVGNYGSAWVNQREEFDRFPGAILMTTNCIQKPKDGYFGRIFTSGLVAFPGVVHVKDRNFKPVIEAALKADGFKEDGPGKKILIGFGRNAVMSVASPTSAVVDVSPW